MGVLGRIFGGGGTATPFESIEAGMVFRVRGGDFYKVVHVEEHGVHVVAVGSGEPIAVDGIEISMGGMHMPMSREAWESGRPRHVRTEPVDPDELEGYEMWRADGGGWF